MSYRNKFPQLLEASQARTIHCGFVAHGLGWSARDKSLRGCCRRGGVEVGVEVMGLFMPVNWAPTAKTQDFKVF